MTESMQKQMFFFRLHLFYLKTTHFKPQITSGAGVPHKSPKSDYIVRWGLDDSFPIHLSFISYSRPLISYSHLLHVQCSFQTK